MPSFPLDPLALNASNYIPFLRGGGKMQTQHLNFNAPVTGAQMQLDTTSDASTGLFSGTVITRTATGTVSAGDFVELVADGTVQTMVANSTRVIGVATGTATTGNPVTVRITGFMWGKNNGDSNSMIAGQYAIPGAGVNTANGSNLTTNRFGRIYTSSASSSASSLIMMIN